MVDWNQFEPVEEPKKSALPAPQQGATTAADASGGIDWGQFEPVESPVPHPSAVPARRFIADPALSAAKGIIGAGEAVVGLADIPTLGHAGKALHAVTGYDPKVSRDFIDEFMTPEQRAATKRVTEAEGFIPTVAEAIKNPSVIAHTAIESAPSMIGAGGIARAIVSKAAPAAALKIAPVAAGIGEGLFSSGSTAEQIRQQSDTGLLTPKQSAIAAVSGAATGALGAIGGKIATKLGIADVDTWLASGKINQEVKKGFLRKVFEGVLAEGALEELPQSAQEQIAQNLALAKPWHEGVANAAALGMLAGGVMGGGANVIAAVSGKEPVIDLKQDETGRFGIPSAVPPGGPADTERPTDPNAPVDLLNPDEVATMPTTAATPAAEGVTAPTAVPMMRPKPVGIMTGIDLLNPKGESDEYQQARELQAKYPDMSLKEIRDMMRGTAADLTAAAARPAPAEEAPESQGVGITPEMIHQLQQSMSSSLRTKSALPAGIDTGTVDQAAHEAATSPLNETLQPSEGQKEKGNYKKGHIRLHGMDISIENPQGSTRSGVSPEGKPWETTLQSHYGYIKGTEGKDKDHIDTFIGRNPGSQGVYVVNQIDPKTGKFDEHKVMMGFNSQEEAQSGYLANYEPGWQGLGSITPMTMQEFKGWLKSGNTKAPVGPGGKKMAAAEPGGLRIPPMRTAVPVGIETGVGISDTTVRAINNPERTVSSAVGEATKRQTKQTVQEAMTSGEVPVNSPIRFVPLQAIVDIIKNRRLAEGKDFEGKEGISAYQLNQQVLDYINDQGELLPTPAPGPSTKINGAVIFPADAVIGKGQAVHEVKVKQDVDVTKLRFTIDGEGKILTFDEIQKVMEGREAKGYDKEDIAGVSGEVGERKEPVKAEPEQRAGGEEAGRSGDVQTHEEEVKEQPEAPAPSEGTQAESQGAEIPAPESEAPKAEALAPAKKEFRSIQESFDKGATVTLHNLLKSDKRTITRREVHQIAEVKQRQMTTAQMIEKLKKEGFKIGKAKEAPAAAEETKEPAAEEKAEGQPEEKAEGEEPDVTPLDGWEDNIIRARDYAIKLRIQEKIGKKDWLKRSAIVKAIKAHLAGKTEEPAETEEKKEPKTPKVPKTKIKSTDTALRRHWELRKERVEASADKDADEQLKAIQKETSRADLFDVPLGENATPGARRLIEEIRNNIKPFTEWVGHAHLGAWRSKRSWAKNMLPAARLMEALKGTSEQATTVRNLATSYIELLGDLRSELSGLQTVTEIGEKYTAWRRAGEEAVSSRYYERAEHGRKVGDVWFNSLLRRIGRFNPADKFYFEEYLNKEHVESSRKQSLHDRTAHKLEDIERQQDLPDYRNGRDITAEELKQTFGFASVTYGKYATQQVRQLHTNHAYDALNDLAVRLGAQPSDISLGGTLHVAIGALGHGKYSATYHHQHPSPDGGTVNVINLTRDRGDGALAHEWGHALDYFLRKTDDGGFKMDRLIGHLKHRYNVEDLRSRIEQFLKGNYYYKGSKASFRDNALRFLQHERQRLSMGKSTMFQKHAADLDAGKGEKNIYWSKPTEMFARAFEATVFDTLNGSNPYLVNGFVSEGKAKPPVYKGTAYPEGEERSEISGLISEMVDNLEWAADGPKFKAGAAFSLDSQKNDYLKEIDNISENIDAFWAHMRQKAEKPEVEDRPAEAPEAKEEEQAEVPENASTLFTGMDDAAIEALIDDKIADELPQTPRETLDVVSDGPKVAEEKKEQREEENRQPVKDEKTLGSVAKEFADAGIEGVTEALDGLYKLFGGGRVKMFIGADEDTYKAAKPHFINAYRATLKAGRSAGEFVQLIVKSFGAKIKPFLMRFMKDVRDGVVKIDEPVEISQEQTQDALDEPPVKTPSQKIADAVAGKLKQGEKITKDALIATADHEFGGTRAEGKYTSKDMFDALEMGVNRYVMESYSAKAVQTDSAEYAQAVIDELRKEVMDHIPSQMGLRSEEQEEFQQYSTPPDLAYVMAWAANIQGIDHGTGAKILQAGGILPNRDTVLEPSAGIGGIAMFAKMAHAKTVVNELSQRRSALLRVMGFDLVFNENAEQINNILPDDVKPTVVLMNPPFSATAGRMKGTKSSENGIQHMNQALARLRPGGRAVILMGLGKFEDSKAMKNWIAEMSKGEKYSLRAVVEVSGKGYQKYGTMYDTRIFVIDKVAGKAENIVKGRVEDVKDAIPLLKEIRDDRPGVRQAGRAAESAATQPGSTETAEGSEGAVLPGESVSPATGELGPEPGGGVSTGEETHAGESASESEGQPAGEGVSVSQPGRGRKSGARPGKSAGKSRGSSDSDTAAGSGEGPQQSEVESRGIEEEKSEGQLTESLFEPYKPQRLEIPGAKPHPGNLVQSAAMATVQPPAPTYTPNLPKSIVNKGLLSSAQLEAVTYAGQAHEQQFDGTDANGQPVKFRKGYFIGDGTGVGKGREISGIIMDNMRQGRKKAGWVTQNSKLLHDAVRDWEGIGGNKDAIFDLGKVKRDKTVDRKEGIMFATYGALRSGSSYDRSGNKDAQKSTDARIDQIIKWVGEDFDGVLVFDEAHNMAGATQTRGTRGMRRASSTGLAGLEIQKRLPNARIVYVSATGATEVNNLGYAERLGLWGHGTAFPTKQAFITDMTSGGLAAMEIVARDAKAMGVYISRNLSYDDVQYDTLKHELSADQRKVYNRLAEAWQVTLKNLDAALKATGVTATGHTGQTVTQNSDAKGAALSKFWGSNQRFFNQVLTAMQMPSVVADVEKQLAAGKSVVMQLVNTNEATQKRRLAEMGEDEELEDLDLTPRDMLIEYLKNAFPVQQFEEYLDDEGNTKSRPVFDSKGNPVLNKEALEMRDKMIEDLVNIKVPQGPLEIIMDHFGTDAVAEVTGRQQRVVWKVDEKGNKSKVIDRWSEAKSVKDADLFQEGKKRILVFSYAGGTGASFHADLSKKNQEQRVHYLVQAGWEATRAVQGFGRTHRTNQKSAPVYKLVTTDLNGQKRFMSSIARRLDQLGAITKGQRQAGSQGIFKAEDNLENHYAADALYRFFVDLKNDAIPRMDWGTVTKSLGLDNLLDANGALNTGNLPQIPRFLNRILSVDIDLQNQVFDAFHERLVQNVERAMAEGKYDVGLENYKADSVKIDSEQAVYTQPGTGAETKYVEMTAKHKNNKRSFEDISKGIAAAKARYKDSIAGFYRNKKSGKLWAFQESGSRTDAKTGQIIQMYRRDGVGSHQYKFIPETDFGPQVIGDSQWDTYEPVSDTDAKRMWDQAYSTAPAYREEKLHLMTGVLLPIWDRLPSFETKVYRVQTDEGQRLIGRLIPDRVLDAVLKNLGAKTEGYTPERVFAALRKGDTVRLANGWRIKMGRVSGENRIEITGDLWAFEDELQNAGAFMEKVEYKRRWFIPNGTSGKAVIEKIIENKPVAEISTGQGETSLQVAKPSISPKGYEAEIASEKENLNYAISIAEKEGYFEGRSLSLLKTDKVFLDKMPSEYFARMLGYMQAEKARLLQVGASKGEIAKVDQAIEAYDRLSLQAGRPSLRISPDQLSGILQDMKRIMAPGSTVDVRSKIEIDPVTLAKALKQWGQGNLSAEVVIKGAHRTFRLNGGALASMVDLSLSNMDMTTPYHEAFHSVQELLLSDEEQAILDRRFKAREGVSSKERQAEAFAQWVLQKKGFGTKTDTIFAKIRRFFERLGNMLRGRGFKTVEDIFRAAYEGQLNERVADDVWEPSLQIAVREQVHNLLQSDRTFNRWWHKTVGTQYHKAQVDKDFRRVYDLGQDFLSDFSRTAMDAEEQAPTLLSKVTRGRDLFKLGIGKAHAEAVGRAVFASTLADRVYSNEELRDKLKLSPKQIRLYREYRAAVDRSIDDLAKSTIAKIINPVVDMGEMKAFRDMGLEEFTKHLYDDYLKGRREDLKAELEDLQSRLEALDLETAKDEEVAAEKEFLEKQIETITEDKKQLDALISDVYKTKARAAKLKDEGYAPLMRFGQHSVYVTGRDEEGQPVEHYFGLYESQREANEAARALQQEFPKAKVTRGILSQESHRLFKGLTPDVIEMFADITGMDKDPIFQDYLRLAVNNRSAMKRLMHRKGIAGFSQDPTRTLSQFIVSNARLTSANYNMGEMRRAIQDIPKGKGDVKDEAVKLHEYLTEPKEEAATLRGFLFFNYLGGSAASGIINATQPVLMTAPYLTQFAGAATVTKEMLKAAKEAASHTYGADVAEALKEAERQGITSPHEIHQLMAEARVGMEKRIWWRNFTKAWGGFFSLAEQWNRQVTFIAAFRIATAKGETNPFTFARKAVEETQGVYNRGNRPNWARGPVGATVMTFKQFSIAYLEFLRRLPRRQKVAALAILMLASGIQGLPFREDLEDLIDTIGQWLGFATNTDKAVKNAVSGLFGRAAGEFILHGASALPGIPLDIQARMGLHNLIPGTALLKPSEQQKGREVAEVFGPVGGVAQAAGKAIEATVKGQGGQAIEAILPKAVRDAIKAVQMWQTGEYRDTAGRLVMRGMTTGETISKGLGFNPARVASQSRTMSTNMADIEIQRTKESELAGQLARAISDQDWAAADAVKREIRDWNQENPGYRVLITSGQIRQRVRELKATRSEKFLKRTPREMRGQIAESMRE